MLNEWQRILCTAKELRAQRIWIFYSGQEASLTFTPQEDSILIIVDREQTCYLFQKQTVYLHRLSPIQTSLVSQAGKKALLKGYVEMQVTHKESSKYPVKYLKIEWVTSESVGEERKHHEIVPIQFKYIIKIITRSMVRLNLLVKAKYSQVGEIKSSYIVFERQRLNPPVPPL